MTEEAEVQRVLHALHSEGWAEFVCCGEQYLIQCENNKGWDYVSLWCTGTGALCLERVLFDGPCGVDAEAVDELLRLPCIGGRSYLEHLARGEISALPSEETKL